MCPRHIGHQPRGHTTAQLPFFGQQQQHTKKKQLATTRIKHFDPPPSCSNTAHRRAVQCKGLGQGICTYHCHTHGYVLNYAPYPYPTHPALVGAFESACTSTSISSLNWGVHVPLEPWLPRDRLQATKTREKASQVTQHYNQNKTTSLTNDNSPPPLPTTPRIPLPHTSKHTTIQPSDRDSILPIIELTLLLFVLKCVYSNTSSSSD